MLITLSVKQQEYADKIGADRQAHNERIGRRDAYGFSGDGKEIHIQGARAELAVSLALNLEWSEFSENYDEIKADVGKNIQVRSTKNKDGPLLLHPKDRGDQVFVLAKLHDFPTVELTGWAMGSDVKLKRYWEDGSRYRAFRGRPCYRYPFQKLNPMRTLGRDGPRKQTGEPSTLSRPIHGGKSIREDCERCDRFVRFSVWRGKVLDNEDQKCRVCVARPRTTARFKQLAGSPP